MVSALMISATHSGAGKTTVTAAVLRALVRRGLDVRSFKVGPDFIDPMYHSEITGRPSVNLDVWMMGEDGVRRTFEAWSAGADIVVIEAMGALFDGADGTDEGSAAHVARLLGVPVLVVMDVWGMTRTASALMAGMSAFDPRVAPAGFVLNRVGGDTHTDLILRSLTGPQREAVVGALPADPLLEVEERHLGLVTTHENPDDPERRSRALGRAADRLDVDRLLALAARSRTPEPPAPVADSHDTDRTSTPPGPRLAIARDAAFCFYYEDNLRLLARAGFTLVPFSPLNGEPPPEAEAVYLGGGYPESFAAELAAAVESAAGLRAAAERGVPVYAECGGLLYLGRSLTGFDGSVHTMAGVLPLDCAMDPDHLAIRYVEARTRHASPLGPAGTVLRGQEFHRSRVVAADIEPDLYDVVSSAGERFVHGYRLGSVMGSYVHAHFAADPAPLEHLVAAARARIV
ncbi:cobyrinate a,c-diamide synthase [Nocardiopsis alba]|uniref:cobyrinate a,c-diamide synthase n=1 Tax=Nocardiopsis alba TaxID=53437 RepID=UPI0033D99E95